ncbi:protein kinase [Chelatococcus sp. SYSU_G07232]|uniref:Protein kinase n=1 Tax=Chelatococcus albus TaxID=3047466 RepID=A0ABT7ADB4_9HYPH|nr:bifunctional protein-serine/threonine kinase/phosphatase [Chelatococcus sp. SYSU_G07232]MDJ1156997.1 protein kinase [Chelatococcus sp. SYSU_G07232]
MRDDHRLRVDLGFASDAGRRAENEDYIGACMGPPAVNMRHGIVAAVADGVGGHKGGRTASELAVRTFIEGYYAQPETLGVQRAAARALEAINGWIAAQSRVDPALEGMGTTFTAVVLARRSCHILHVGDSRLYRLSEGRLERLTKDHTVGRGDFAHALNRAVGFEDDLRIDHAVHGLRLHDRFLLCTDGVHGALADGALGALLGKGGSPAETARNIVAAAVAADGSDNATALVIDVVDLPPADEAEISRLVSSLPIGKLPEIGETVDGFRLDDMLSDGRYSRLFRATDLANGEQVALKFPHPRVAQEASYRLAFVSEAWVSARVRSPWIGEIIEVAPGRRTRLYSVMPFYDGETLEQRLKRAPPLSLAEGAEIATRLARAVATLHRSGIIHRDIKPDNVILLKSGGLRLVDLGVARVPRLEDFPEQDIPGTPSYMAPEVINGNPGDEASDLFALGVTIYRAFSGAYPYGEIEPFSRPRFGKPVPLTRHRPDLPAWIDAVLSRAIAVKPSDRYCDVIEFAFEIENGAARARPSPPQRTSLHERNPLLFWQVVAALLGVLLIISLATR